MGNDSSSASNLDVGFLPNENVSRLCEPAFEELERIMDDLPALNRTGDVRKRVTTLKEIPRNALVRLSEREARRLYVVLAFLIQSYAKAHTASWDDCTRPSQKKITAKDGIHKTLAVPWSYVCRRLGLPLVISAAATDLWNYRRIDSERDVTLSNISLISSMTGTEAESYFHLTPTAIHARFSAYFPILLSLPSAIEGGQDAVVLECLSATREMLLDVRTIFRDGTKKIDKDVFYHLYRPLLQGYDGSTCLCGVMALSTDGNDTPGYVRLKGDGPSGGQSTMFLMLDVALGIEHGANTSAFQEKAKAHMPRSHREVLDNFVSRMKACGSLRDYIETSKNTEALCRAYRTSVDAYASFRSLHLGVATATLKATATGTGGSTFRKLLVSFLNETKASARACSP